MRIKGKPLWLAADTFKWVADRFMRMCNGLDNKHLSNWTDIICSAHWAWLYISLNSVYSPFCNRYCLYLLYCSSGSRLITWDVVIVFTEQWNWKKIVWRGYCYSLERTFFCMTRFYMVFYLRLCTTTLSVEINNKVKIQYLKTFLQIKCWNVPFTSGLTHYLISLSH